MGIKEKAKKDYPVVNDVPKVSVNKIDSFRNRLTIQHGDTNIEVVITNRKTREEFAEQLINVANLLMYPYDFLLHGTEVKEWLDRNNPDCFGDNDHMDSDDVTRFLICMYEELEEKAPFIQVE